MLYTGQNKAYHQGDPRIQGSADVGFSGPCEIRAKDQHTHAGKEKHHTQFFISVN